MDNPEHYQLWSHEIEGAIKNGQSRALLTLDTRDWRSNQEWAIQRHWQINVRENRREDNQEWTIQSTVNFGHTRLKSNQEWTIQSTANFGHTRLKEQSIMDNPEHCQLWAHEIEGAIKNGQSRALSTLGTRDWRSNQEWTIQSTANFGHTRLKEQSRMDNPEHCQLGHTRLKEQSRMDNPEHC